jgi:hypothetical protein
MQMPVNRPQIGNPIESATQMPPSRLKIIARCILTGAIVGLVFGAAFVFPAMMLSLGPGWARFLILDRPAVYFGLGAAAGLVSGAAMGLCQAIGLFITTSQRIASRIPAWAVRPASGVACLVGAAIPGIGLLWYLLCQIVFNLRTLEIALSLYFVVSLVSGHIFYGWFTSHPVPEAAPTRHKAMGNSKFRELFRIQLWYWATGVCAGAACGLVVALISLSQTLSGPALGGPQRDAVARINFHFDLSMDAGMGAIYGFLLGGGNGALMQVAAPTLHKSRFRRVSLRAASAVTVVTIWIVLEVGSVATGYPYISLRNEFWPDSLYIVLITLLWCSPLFERGYANLPVIDSAPSAP